jgi:hypothetical protein
MDKRLEIVQRGGGSTHSNWYRIVGLEEWLHARHQSNGGDTATNSDRQWSRHATGMVASGTRNGRTSATRTVEPYEPADDYEVASNEVAAEYLRRIRHGEFAKDDNDGAPSAAELNTRPRNDGAAPEVRDEVDDDLEGLTPLEDVEGPHLR